MAAKLDEMRHSQAQQVVEVVGLGVVSNIAEVDTTMFLVVLWFLAELVVLAVL